jgi:hypothetical protein
MPYTKKVTQQKSSNTSYRGPRLNPQQRTAMMKAAREITERYPLRFWAQWTTRTFGWWSMVCAGRWAEIAPCRRDLDEVRWALRRARDEDKLRAEIQDALDEVRRREMALVESVDDVTRIVKALGR